MNTHLAIAIHALTLLAQENNGPLSATYIAASIDTHPVFLRRVLNTLQKAGLIDSQRGANGGVRLLRPPEKITLLDVYSAISQGEDLLKIHPSPNPACPVGGKISGVLETHFEGAVQALQAYFNGVTIANLLADVTMN